MNIGAYTIPETLSETNYWQLYVGQNGRAERFMLKCSQTGERAAIAERMLRQEWDISRLLESPTRPLALEQHEDRWVVVRPFYAGKTLREWLKEAPDVGARLRVAVQLARSLEVLYPLEVVHTHLHPDHLLVSPDGQQVTSLDYTYAVRLRRSTKFLGNPYRLEEDLHYLAPEQSGRTNLTVDYRADLYALGVLLYEIFTGKLPFVADKPAEVLHAHLAKTPIPPVHLEPSLPPVLSSVILKLLAKHPDDRYQSAIGLRRDLERIEGQWQGQGRVDAFSLATSDVVLAFQLSSKLYGRQTERERLSQAFQAVTKGRKMLVLLSGFSGSGKTALVNDLHAPIRAVSGFFSSGKFEQYQRNLPYFAWKQAFEKWVEWLLSQSPAYIAEWRNRLQTVIGEQLGILLDLVPGLEKIVGTYPVPAEVSPTENQNRFQRVARLFLKTVCQPEHPVVVFLDDLQWADPASLTLLRVALTEPTLGNLLVVCAYRDHETPPGHPFLQTVDILESEWQKTNDISTGATYAPDNVLVKRIALSDLAEVDIRALIQDSIPIPADDAQNLAKDVFAKTRGNAYFTHRLLESLYEVYALGPDASGVSPYWHYDAAAAQNFGLSDNVIALLERKVEQLSARAQALLRNAACIGLQFDVGTLRVISQLSPAQTVLFLREAVENELIAPLGSESLLPLEGDHVDTLKYQFTHDRVRQAVYAALPEDTRRVLHYQAGHLLLQTLTVEQQEARIFEVANHLNEAGALVTDLGQLSHLNYRAALRAKSAIAYGLAYDYATKALDCLPPNHWTEQYAWSMQLYHLCAEVAALDGNYAAMEPLLDTILREARTPLEKVDALNIRISSLFFREQIQESLAEGRAALAMLGVKLPKRAGQLEVVRELLKTNWVMRNKSPEQLLQQPLMTDPLRLGIINIMSRLAPSLFFSDPNLFVILNMRMAQMNSRYGPSLLSLYGYANYAFIISVATHQLSRGAAFSKLALQLAERYPQSPNISHVYFIAHFFVDHWTQHSRHTLTPLKNAYAASLAKGEVDFMAFLGNAYTQNALLNGVALGEMEQELHAQAQHAQQTNPMAYTFNRIYQQFVQCLQGKAPQPHTLAGDVFDPAVQREEVTGLLTNQNYYQTQLSLLYGEYAMALQALDLTDKGREQIKPVPIGKHFDFLTVLVLAHTARSGEESANKRFRRALKALRWYAKHSAEEFTGKVKLSEATYAAWKGKIGEAMSLFQEAEILLKKEGNLYDQALAFLEMYRFHEAQQHEEVARLYLQKATQTFQRWGAEGVVDYLSQHQSGRQRKGAAKAAQSGIDVYSLAKGAQVISGELDLHQLTAKMLAVMAENAGAGRGVLLLPSEAGYRVVATLQVGEEAVWLTHPTPMAQYPDACAAVLHYVVQSGQNLVVEDASQDNRFLADSYVRAKGLRSVMATHILHQGKSAGVLYLENNLTSGAFNTQRLEVLQILGAQAAISLENARYYQDIQHLNRAYERFVPQHFLQQLNKRSILDIQRGDQKVGEMAVMFSDIWGFTTLSERLPAAKVFELLNEIWELLTPIIERNGGIVDKYMGDAVMALFPQNADGALQAAVDMQAALLPFSAARAVAYPVPLKMGIGLNYGTMILGTVGSASRMDTTVIGDAVNIAARLESATRQYHCGIVCSAELRARLQQPDAFSLRAIGTMALRGKSQRVAVYEEYANDPLTLRAAKTQTAEQFAAFLAAYERGELPQAASLLHQYQLGCPDDSVAAYYAALLRQRP